ncbi:MAG: hypothetical protein ACPG6X_04790 [Synechococcus sp.]
MSSPVLVFAALVMLAPSVPTSSERQELRSASRSSTAANTTSFQYIPDDEVYALELDPRKVRFGLLEGWDREQDAFEDTAAHAFVSGPMYERHIDIAGQELTVPLGDLKFGSRIWRGRNRTASIQRAYVGIRHDGQVDFSYGALTDERARRYETFIGGLHSLYNDLEAPPDSYKGAYSISMGQRIRYYLPRIRMVIGLRGDGRLEVLMSRDGLTLEQTKDLARRRGYLAAYMPDHASKSRLIIPGVKGFTEEDANWISGGATSFVHVPYLLRLSERNRPLRGDLLAGVTQRIQERNRCDGPLDCSRALGGHLMDRALAGLNRVMEQGVEPLARMIWAPTPSPKQQRLDDGGQVTPDNQLQRSPLREPPITADPLVLRDQPLRPEPQSDDWMLAPAEPDLPEPEPTQLPPDLPPPELFDQDAAAATDPNPDLDDLFGAPPPPALPPLPVLPAEPPPLTQPRQNNLQLP